jgi:drug/metabolite transporter (DMT)-like permease
MAQLVAKHGLLFLVAFGMVFSQLLMRRGMKGRAVSLTSFRSAVDLVGQILTSPSLLAGYALSVILGLIWLVVLSRMELSYATPIMTALYYVLLLVASAVVLGERVDVWRGAGTVLILAGMLLVARSG